MNLQPPRPPPPFSKSFVMTTRTNSGNATTSRSQEFAALSSAGMIIAGYDRRHGGQVYSIPLGGSLHKQAYAIGGSGSTYIYGYCDAHWKEEMTEQEGVEFVKGALREAIKWDGSSGGVIRMVVLTAKGAVRHLYLPDNLYTGPGTK
jgi:20S proteasome subunit beta 1